MVVYAEGYCKAVRARDILKELKEFKNVAEAYIDEDICGGRKFLSVVDLEDDCFDDDEICEMLSRIFKRCVHCYTIENEDVIWVMFEE